MAAILSRPQCVKVSEKAYSENLSCYFVIHHVIKETYWKSLITKGPFTDMI